MWGWTAEVYRLVNKSKIPDITLLYRQNIKPEWVNMTLILYRILNRVRWSPTNQ